MSKREEVINQLADIFINLDTDDIQKILIKYVKYYSKIEIKSMKDKMLIIALKELIKSAVSFRCINNDLDNLPQEEKDVINEIYKESKLILNFSIEKLKNL